MRIVCVYYECLQICWYWWWEIYYTIADLEQGSGVSSDQIFSLLGLAWNHRLLLWHVCLRIVLVFNLLYTLFHLENPEDLQEDSEIQAWGKMLLDPVEGPRIKVSLLNFLQLQSSLEVFQENLYPVQENLHLLTYLYDLNPKFVR